VNAKRASGERLAVDPISCTGHGMCAELFPEWIELDDWGYPMINRGDVPPELREHAERAVNACPALALRLRRELS
jgi:ferredoxin